MQRKKLIAGILLLAIFIAQISMIPFSNIVYAQENENQNFHYQQLNDTAKNIYNGIYEMYEQGTLKTGNETLDLAKDNKYVTQAQLEAYMKGNTELKTAMNAARYAFYADYPEVFYVDFQKLSLRVTKDAQGRYHANLGSGNQASYYVEGFTKENIEKAIQDFNARVNEIKTGAEQLTIKDGQNRQAEQVKYVHNEIITNVGYRLESDCYDSEAPHLGTPYGTLIIKKAVCEGYARALKTVLDKLNIPCILVQGVHQSEGSAEVPHMWNYVQIEQETTARSTEKVWYAVDATLDDPFLRSKDLAPGADREPGWDIVEEIDGARFESTRLCMVGKRTMDVEHTALENVEAAGNYKFEYPELSVEDYEAGTTIHNNGLKVNYKQLEGAKEEQKAGAFYISYNGMGYKEAKEQGFYFLMNSLVYNKETNQYDSNWGYLLIEPQWIVVGVDYGDHIYMVSNNSEYLQFAMTKQEPQKYSDGTIDLHYYENETDEFFKTTRTETIHNINGTYVGKPYIKTQTPKPYTDIPVGSTVNVEVIYDEELVLADGATQAGYNLESTGPTGVSHSKIENFKFEAPNKITFKFTPSNMYADDGAVYKIHLTGLVGKDSQKVPLEITYGAINQIGCAFNMNKNQNWEVFGRPTLLENEDLSMDGWKTSDGESVSDKLKARIALVTTKPSKDETENMNNMIQNNSEQEVYASETYNISLNVCRKYVVQTGHRLRISVGFPAGYGPEDAGVTFKAYHFIRDNAGNVTGVEEIPCVVTPYGLIITCDAFSPFAIAAVEADETQVATAKTVIVSATDGGVIDGANREEGNILTLNPGETATLTIRADDGYRLETLTAFGEEKENAQTLTIRYEDIKDGNNIVDATFVAEEVLQQEEENGETVVTPTVTPATVSIQNAVTASLGTSAIIQSKVEVAEGIPTYQWYKDGVKLEGKINPTLSIDEAKETDAGVYTLKVTTTVGTLSQESTSNECTLTVRGLTMKIVPTGETIDLTAVESGTEFTVSANIEKFSNIGDGILAVMGQLEYDTNVLELKSIQGIADGWRLDGEDFNPANFKFVTAGNPVKEPKSMFTMQFAVKADIPADTNATTIKIKNITAGTGETDGLIQVQDTQIEVGLSLSAEEITSEVYRVDKTKQQVSRIVPGVDGLKEGTTVATFKQNVTANRTIQVIDKEGNAVADDAVIRTGYKVKVGRLEYTLIVTGDIDGSDGIITVNDLAQLKKHLIEKQLLTGAALEAANVDNDDLGVTINDLAQVKKALLGKKEITN